MDSRDPRFIPFSIADQGCATTTRWWAPRQAARPAQRAVAVSDVLDLLEVPALRSRFGIAEDALPLLRRWIHGARVRWGLHAAHRQSLGLPDAPEGNTWLFGLRRMLLGGYAVGATGGAWHDIEPFDEIGGLDAALFQPAGAAAGAARRHLAGLPATPPGRLERRLRRLMADFFAPDDSADAFTLQRLDQAWCAGRRPAPPPASTARCRWRWSASTGWPARRQRPVAALLRRHGDLRHADADARHPLPPRLPARPQRRRLPAHRVPMDFDLMGRDYRPGDRSRREDDRYPFSKPCCRPARSC